MFSWTPSTEAIRGLFVDYDSDGDQDLYLINFQTANQLHRNDDAIFTVLAHPEAFHESAAATGAFFADLDGDGAVELFSTHRFSQPNQWIHGPGTPAMTDQGRLVSPLRAGNDVFGATPFDYDGDGDLDIYVSAFSGGNLLHQNHGGGHFRSVPEAAGMASDRSSIAAVPADINADGSMDLYVLNAIGQANHLFVRGDSAYRDVAVSSGIGDESNSPAAPGRTSTTMATRTCSSPTSPCPCSCFVTTALQRSDLPERGTTGVAVADVDRDGDIDAFMASPEGVDVLLINDSDAEGWLRVDLGQSAHRAGTRVELVQAGRRQVRRFAVASSIDTQHGNLLHFGLGPTPPDSVELRIDWPSGVSQRLMAATSQVLRVGADDPSPESQGQDLSIARVLAPGLAPGWEGFRPQVEIHNQGQKRSPATDLVACFQGPGRTYERRRSVVSLAAGDWQQISFDNWRPDLPGVWEISFALTGEDDASANNRWSRPYRFYEFQEVTSELGIDDDGPDWAGALADYDNDGDLDLSVSNGGSLRNGANVLYRNDGASGFRNVTMAAGVADEDNGTGVVFADFDRDGDQDLFLAKGGFTSDGQANRMFSNDGDGTFSDISAEAGLDISRSSYATVVRDYDRDGLLDLYVSQLRGQEASFYRNLQGHFEDVTNSKRVLSFFQFSGAAAFSDYDNDGDVDLYAGVFGDFDRFYADVGQSAYAVASVGGKGDMVGVAVGDHDEDGDLDLYTVNQNGRSALYKNHPGLSLFLDVGSETGTENMALGTGCASVDFDSDGDLDLLVTNAFSSDRAYVNLGDNTFLDQSVTFAIADTSRGRAVLTGDIDNDGDQDIYVINEGTHNRLYANGGGPHGWLSVTALNVTSNPEPDAVGARLTSWVDGVPSLREVNGTSGMSYSSRLHTLVWARRVNSLVVRWPSGTVDRHGPLQANTALHLVEGGALTAVVEAENGDVPRSSRLAEAYPNPFNATVILRFEMPSEERVRLAVYNSLGQQVRILVADQMLPAGRHGITCNGRNDAAQAVASGVYYARMEAISKQQVQSTVRATAQVMVQSMVLLRYIFPLRLMRCTVPRAGKDA